MAIWRQPPTGLHYADCIWLERSTVECGSDPCGQPAHPSGQDFDAILIFLGTNDYNRGILIGEWFHETLSRHRSPGKPAAEQVLKNATHVHERDFQGPHQHRSESVKKTFRKQVVLLTPTHRGYAKFGATTSSRMRTTLTTSVNTSTPTSMQSKGETSGRFRLSTSMPSAASSRR